MLRVKVRGGYSIRVANVDYHEHQIFNISDEDYKARHWIFEIVKEDPPAVKEEPVVSEEAVHESPIAEAVAPDDTSNRAIDSPVIGSKVRRRK